MRDRIKDDGQQVIVPDCKECIYAIEEGIEGCELDNQTMRIKIGMDKCEFKEKYIDQEGINIIVNKFNKQYELKPCRMCRSIEYDIVEYHNDKDNSIVVDAIKCANCGKVYFSFKRLTIDDM